MLAVILVASASIATILFLYYYLLISGVTKQKYGGLSKNDSLRDRRILLLIAHPDDECMFFAPAILSLHENNDVMVLCLSSGDESGLGEIRKKELEKSCNVLGIHETAVNIEEHPSLQDDPAVLWNSGIISNILKDYVEKNGVDTIVTFDERGISGHLNHISAYHGASRLLKEYDNTTIDVQLYKLRTVNLIRKYISILDLPITYFKHDIAQGRLNPPQKDSPKSNDLHQQKGKDLRKKPRPPPPPLPAATQAPNSLLFVSSPHDFFQARNAMKCHKSQLVWFRYLYVLFSRYMLINELERVK